MRSFKHYLAESVRSYRYKIKIAGEMPKNFAELFIHNLSKFDPVKVGTPKSTPVQRSQIDFPLLEDQAVTIIDVEFRYPCTEPMVKQLARLLGYDENMVRMTQADYEDGLANEQDMYANQASHSPVLLHAELEDNGKQASKEYGDSYLGRIKEQEKGRALKNSYAAKETANAFDPFNPKQAQEKMGNKSPMSKMTRPALPKTGAKTK